ncbi:MAG: chemoreceptor glutamine deamidase CheD [Pseudomonadota bacterium]
MDLLDVNVASVETSDMDERNDIYFDREFKAYAKRIQPGEYKIIDDSEQMLTTILGSCVAACIRDPILGIGGMNHFLLPEQSHAKKINSEATRYGNHAMELLINDLLKLGCKRDRFEIKAFGGASVSNMNVSIGEENSKFIMNYIQLESLKLESFDLGGKLARRICYFPKTGRVSRMFLIECNDVRKREIKHQKRIKNISDTSYVELFD